MVLMKEMPKKYAFYKYSSVYLESGVGFHCSLGWEPVLKGQVIHK
jgi:hypothetical protein